MGSSPIGANEISRKIFKMGDISPNMPEDDILDDEPLLYEPGPKRMVKVLFITKRGDEMKDDSKQDEYINARLKEVEKSEIDETKRLYELEVGHVKKLVNTLHKVKTFEEHPLNFDTDILFDITSVMKSYIKKIAKLRDDNETISGLWALLEVLTSSLFNELYRTDRSFTSKWAILDEINDFFINFLDKDIAEIKDRDNYDISQVGPTVLLMLRQTYKLNILKLYADTRLNEHLHDINEILIDDGILYVAETETEFYAKVEESVVAIFMENAKIKKIIDDIVEKIY